jgi:hypothetical protein
MVNVDITLHTTGTYAQLQLMIWQHELQSTYDQVQVHMQPQPGSSEVKVKISFADESDWCHWRLSQP